MNSPIRMTPRQAAYRDLCAVIAQMSGRSRRAQRSLLEAELVRALERAYDFQQRCALLSATVASQTDKVLGAEIEIAVAEGAARQRVQAVRQEVLAVVERCQAFEGFCEEFLLATREGHVEPPPLVVTPSASPEASDVDEEAVTERVPGSKTPWAEKP